MAKTHKKFLLTRNFEHTRKHYTVCVLWQMSTFNPGFQLF